MKNKNRIQEEIDMCPSVLKLLQRFSIQTPFTVHFSPFLCGSLQTEHRPPCLTPPDNEPSITTGCGNYPQGRALTDSRDVSCMAAAGLPHHVSPHIHILQRGTTTGVNMVCPCNKNGKHLHGSVVTLCKPEEGLHQNSIVVPSGSIVCMHGGLNSFAPHFLLFINGLNHVCFLVCWPCLLWSNAGSGL